MRLLHRFIDDVEVKRCCTCHEWLPLDRYNKRINCWDGLQSICISCRSETHKKLKEVDYTMGRKQHLKRKFNMTEEDYLQKYLDQGGVCAICGGPPNGVTKFYMGNNFSIDHDHKTGEVRGLVCQSCNHGLGCFKDSPVLLQKAIDYLVSWGNSWNAK
jgi:hypothetical protein